MDDRKELELYKKMYYMLFNSMTDAITVINQGDPQRAAELLRQAQQLGEEFYIEA